MAAKAASAAIQTAACVAYAAECLRNGGAKRVLQVGGLKARTEHEARLRELKKG
jgi:hypothetical protein